MDHVAYAKQGDNVLGSFHPSVCLSACRPPLSWLNRLPSAAKGKTRHGPKCCLCVCTHVGRQRKGSAALKMGFLPASFALA